MPTNIGGAILDDGVRPKPVEHTKKPLVLVVIVTIVLAGVVGYTVYEGPEPQVTPVAYELASENYQTISLTWLTKTYQMVAARSDVLPQTTFTLVNQDSRWVSAYLLSFDGFNGTDATDPELTIPLAWFAIYPANETPVPVYLYKVMGAWEPWTTEMTGVTWAIVRDTPGLVDRTPIDVAWVNESAYGVGYDTKGNLTFDISKAFEDDAWSTEYGFLVAHIPPWGLLVGDWSDTYPWYTSPVLVKYYIEDATIMFTSETPIPEFSVSLAFMVIMMIAMFVILRGGK